MRTVILTESELRQCIDLDSEAIQVVADAFAVLAKGDAIMPPILRLDIKEHNGEVDVKTAYLRGFDSFAVKISPGFFDNPSLGLPSVSGLMVLISAKTGQTEALLLDNGYLTDIRTAAAGAVAAKYLAPQRCTTVGVIGAGTQARLQMQGLHLVRPYKRLLVWARDRAKAERYAQEMGNKLPVETVVVDVAQNVVAESDVVVTTTPAKDPVISADCLHPGLHITAMGSDAEDKNELDPQIVASANLFVCDRTSQSAHLGELHHAIECGTVSEGFSPVEIGQLVAGTSLGRTSADQITVCDLTGTGAQDTAIAVVAHRKALNLGFGTEIVHG
ncbi:MAG: cyclodeaminase [Gammaproteobacteria bacterium]|nr:cyclodeaminase [Gammaproteobacteria bacterium]